MDVCEVIPGVYKVSKLIALVTSENSKMKLVTSVEWLNLLWHTYKQRHIVASWVSWSYQSQDGKSKLWILIAYWQQQAT